MAARYLFDTNTASDAHALALGAVLATSDRLFGRVKGLKVENWARS